jgi:hypothetical protein
VGSEDGGECSAISEGGGDIEVAHSLEAVVAAAFGWPRPGEEGSRAGPTRQ